jgi:hypothetical protein
MRQQLHVHGLRPGLVRLHPHLSGLPDPEPAIAPVPGSPEKPPPARTPEPLAPAPIGDPLPLTEPDPQPLDEDAPPEIEPVPRMPPLVTRGESTIFSPPSHCAPNQGAV